jgi:nucleoside-diphosphate-sugar epimerase
MIAAIEGSFVVFYMDDINLQRDDIYNWYMIIVQGNGSLFFNQAGAFLHWNFLQEVMIVCIMNFHSGAKNVINACRECKVRRLIYNSSADVVFDGLHDINNGDECLTYPWKVCLYL